MVIAKVKIMYPVAIHKRFPETPIFHFGDVVYHRCNVSQPASMKPCILPERNPVTAAHSDGRCRRKELLVLGRAWFFSIQPLAFFLFCIVSTTNVISGLTRICLSEEFQGPLLFLSCRSSPVNFAFTSRQFLIACPHEFLSFVIE